MSKKSIFLYQKYLQAEFCSYIITNKWVNLKSGIIAVAKKITFFLFLAFVFLGKSLNSALTKTVSGLCLDLNHCQNEPTWVSVARKCSIDIKNIPVDYILDMPEQSLTPEFRSVDIVFVNLTDEFFFSYKNPDSLAGKKVIKILEQIGQAKPKHVCIMLPPALSRSWELAREIIEEVCLKLRPDQEAPKDLLDQLNESLSQRAPYATALLTEPEQLITSKTGLSSPETFLKNMYRFETSSKPNSLIFVSSSFLKTISPAEDFRIFPTSRILQELFFSQVVNFFQKIAQANGIEKPVTLKYKDCFSKAKKASGQTQTIKILPDCTRVGWMEIEDFCQYPTDSRQEWETKKQYQAKLIQSIISGALTGLWININPNVLFSKTGIKKDQKQIYLLGLSLLSKNLKIACDESSVAMPKFFLGVEIGNNLVDTNLPKNPERDIWGKTYSDLPCALDKEFWQTQLLSPCQEFLKAWKEFDHSKDFPVFSIVIDLEFYNRKNVGTFTSCMGFGEVNLQNCELDKTLLERWPEKKIKFSQCFTKLSQKALELGQSIAQECLAMDVKNLYFYMPTLDLNWFYAPLLKGASSKVDQCHIFSFANRADLYNSIFDHHKIRASCSPVFMLSKLKDQGKSIKSLSEIANGSLPGNYPMIWLNRFSRIVHPYQPKQWHQIEQSPAEQGTRDLFLKSISN